MAVRTTSTAVQKIIELDSSIIVDLADLDPFIEVASAIIDDVCVPLGYDATRLELIERWLSAHFYAIRDQRKQQEVAGSVSETFQTKVDLYLNVTIYGQQAQMIDTKGGLLRLNKGISTRVLLFWAGTELSS